MTEEGKSRGVAFDAGQIPSAPPQPPPPYYYGTFQGVANYQQQQSPPPQPAFAFPQPVPPPAYHPNPQSYYTYGYQTVPGYVVSHGRPVLEPVLPCCGCGFGWLLFIFGFVFGAIPWYIGAFILLFVRVDYREKPGLVACTLAAFLALIAVTLGLTRATNNW